MLVVDGRIERIGAFEASMAEDAEKVDFTGKYVVPA
jgi:imidazolonepropionase-like amidohydrolase